MEQNETRLFFHFVEYNVSENLRPCDAMHCTLVNLESIGIR